MLQIAALILGFTLNVPPPTAIAPPVQDGLPVCGECRGRHSTASHSRRQSYAPAPAYTPSPEEVAREKARREEAERQRLKLESEAQELLASAEMLYSERRFAEADAAYERLYQNYAGTAAVRAASNSIAEKSELSKALVLARAAAKKEEERLRLEREAEMNELKNKALKDRMLADIRALLDSGGALAPAGDSQSSTGGGLDFVGADGEIPLFEKGTKDSAPVDTSQEPSRLDAPPLPPARPLEFLDGSEAARQKPRDAVAREPELIGFMFPSGAYFPKNPGERLKNPLTDPGLIAERAGRDAEKVRSDRLYALIQSDSYQKWFEELLTDELVKKSKAEPGAAGASDKAIDAAAVEIAKRSDQAMQKARGEAFDRMQAELAELQRQGVKPDDEKQFRKAVAEATERVLQRLESQMGEIRARSLADMEAEVNRIRKGAK